MAGPIFETPGKRAGELAGKPGVVRFLDLAPARAVMVDGEGAVGADAFGPIMPGLYGTAYTLRFALKRRGVEEKVGPLEGLYWTADGTTDLDVILDADRRGWRWTLLIVLPAAATADELEAALQAGWRRWTLGGHATAPRDARRGTGGPGAARRPVLGRAADDRAPPCRDRWRRACGPAGPTTRSTSATRTGPLPSACGRSCAIPWSLLGPR